MVKIMWILLCSLYPLQMCPKQHWCPVNDAWPSRQLCDRHPTTHPNDPSINIPSCIASPTIWLGSWIKSRQQISPSKCKRAERWVFYCRLEKLFLSHIYNEMFLLTGLRAILLKTHILLEFKLRWMSAFHSLPAALSRIGSAKLPFYL